jgi:hypothetical protein
MILMDLFSLFITGAIEEHKMGGACRTCEKDEEFLQTFSLRYLKGRDHLGDIGVGGRILKWISNKWGENIWTGFI